MKWQSACVYIEILIDLILIPSSMWLLMSIKDEFDLTLSNAGDATVHVINDDHYWGPLQIICLHATQNETLSNCTQQFTRLDRQITPIQNYFSLKYLDILRGHQEVTVGNIMNSRHSLFITLSIYVILWYCVCCAWKLQTTDAQQDYHWVYYVSVSYFENSLALLKMMMINGFAMSNISRDTLLLQFVPAFSIMVFVLFTVVMLCFFGTVQSMYKDCLIDNCKQICIFLVLFIVFMYCVLFIIPTFGLTFYTLRFCAEFEPLGGHLLSAEFVSNVNVLRWFALYMGVSGWIKTCVPLVKLVAVSKIRKYRVRNTSNDEEISKYEEKCYSCLNVLDV
eukprot:426767_1